MMQSFIHFPCWKIMMQSFIAHVKWMISRSRLTGHCHPSLDTRSLYSEAMYTSSSNELEFVDIRTILNTTSSIVRGQTYKDNRLLHRFIKEISSL